ncbi:hypothetical protein [Roseovarius sp. TM1035]|jgi:hypothetical protein|uniref:hypothetical protein n=1 Tax=Roseovarius sp. TM1035 TaxID=391613 RepID=UPI0018DD4194|nr:hypothetical protein [Roseovarius sp. TM1035]
MNRLFANIYLVILLVIKARNQAKDFVFFKGLTHDKQKSLRSPGQARVCTLGRFGAAKPTLSIFTLSAPLLISALASQTLSDRLGLLHLPISDHL